MRKRKRVNKPVNRIPVTILVLCDRDGTVARAEISQFIDGDVVSDTATGSAKREPGDVRDDVIGTNLAAGRALVKLGLSLQHTAHILVADAGNRQEREAVRRVRNRVRRQVRPPKPPAARLSLDEIADRFGYEKADQVADRRGEPRVKRQLLLTSTPGRGRHQRRPAQ